MAFSDKLFEMVNKSMDVSRDIIGKAASQAQVWGEMGVLKIEIIQLRRQAEQLTAQLGAEAYAAFVERGESSLSADAPTVREAIKRITALSKEIDEQEARYRKLGGKDSDLNEGANI